MSDPVEAAGRSDLAIYRGRRRAAFRQNRAQLRLLVGIGIAGGLLAVRRWAIFLAEDGVGVLTAIAAACVGSLGCYVAVTLRRMSSKGIGPPKELLARARAEQKTGRCLMHLRARGCVVLHDRRLGSHGIHLEHVVIGSCRVYLVQNLVADRTASEGLTVPYAANACASDAVALAEHMGLGLYDAVPMLVVHHMHPPAADPATQTVVTGLRRLLDAFPDTHKHVSPSDWTLRTASAIAQQCPPR